MKQFLKKSFKCESGVIMLESIIVYIITLTLLFLILAIFSVLFQRWNIQIIANETAMRVAQTYRVTTADTASGYVSDEDLKKSWEKLSIFRYWSSNDSVMNHKADTRAKEYATNRLSKTTYTHDITEPKIEVNIEEDCIPRRHVNVKITGEYAVPFGEMLGYFGFDSTTKYEVTASAECLDLMEYVTLTDYESALINHKFLNKGITKKVLDCADSFLKVIDHFLEGPKED